MSDVISITGNVVFDIDGTRHTLRKATAKQAIEFSKKAESLNKDEDGNITDTEASLQLSKDVLIECGLPAPVAETLPVEAFGIMISNLIKKKD